jgi:hypothetical protein
MHAVSNFLGELKASGGVESSLDKMQTRQGLYGALKYNPSQEWIYPSATKFSEEGKSDN